MKIPSGPYKVVFMSKKKNSNLKKKVDKKSDLKSKSKNVKVNVKNKPKPIKSKKIVKSKKLVKNDVKIDSKINNNIKNVKTKTKTNEVNKISNDVKVPKIDIQDNNNKSDNGKEPFFLIKPVIKNRGLDYLHISLIALVIILIAFIAILSTFHVVKSVTSYKSCPYGVSNSICIQPKYNSSQALSSAETYIAGYSNLNSSLSLLPYYIDMNKSTVSYLNNSKEWLVVFPYNDPLLNEQYNISMLLYGSNLSLVEPFTQFIRPVSVTKNKAVGNGAIDLASHTYCNTTTPIPTYFITDPYAYDSLGLLSNVINDSKAFNNKITPNYYFIFTGYSQSLYSNYGVNKTQLIGKYLSCASTQPNFGTYVQNLNKIFSYTPLSNKTLVEEAIKSGLNMSDMSSCFYNITSTMNYQAELAKYYNVTQTPEIIVNCKYETIPERFNSTVNYSLSKLPGAK